MKIDIIMTKESDGNWYKVRIDEKVKSCIRIDNKEEGEAYKRATEIYEFYVQAQGEHQIIREKEL
jgi:hypothetical protein